MNAQCWKLTLLRTLLISALLCATACENSGITAAPANQESTAHISAATDAGNVRFVRFEALSEVNGNPWASIAELNLLDANGAPIARNTWRISADSEELSGENAPAGAAIDGNPNSFWHTRWQGANPAPPHWLTIDLGSGQTVTGLRYLPRQIGVNGRVANWRLLTSPDDNAWTLAAQGTFSNSAAEQSATLQAGAGASVQARFVRLQALTEINGAPWSSVAELDLLDAFGARLPHTGWVASADSEETTGELASAQNAIDGDANSFWHTQWATSNAPLPHALTIDLNAIRTLTGFRYLPRQVGVNGRISSWRFFTSLDGTLWTSVAEGQFGTGAVESVRLFSNGALPAANTPPQLAAVADRTDSVGGALTLQLSGNDPDGDPLMYTAIGLPPGMLTAATTGIISGTPTTIGRFTATVQVSDGRGGNAQRSFVWVITAPTIPPQGAARYLRFEALSEVSGNPWSSVAEINVLDADGANISRSGWQISADSQETAGENAPAVAAIDGDPNSFWHSRWKDSSPPPPHWLTIDMGSARVISGLRYLPRQIGSNGRIAAWRLFTSNDGNTWTQVAQGSFANSDSEQVTRFAVPTPPPPPAGSLASARAARVSAFASGPLIAAPAWRAGVAVTENSVRRLSSGHHMVYVSAGIAGPTEPQVGSTAFDGRPITDGSAVAYLTGRILTTSRAGAPGVSAVASAAVAGLTLWPFAAGDFQPPRNSTSQGCRSLSYGTSNLAHYCFAHGPAGGPGNATEQAAGPRGAGLSAAYSYHVNNWTEEFVVTDSSFGVVLANSASPLNVEVDGVPVQAAPTISSGTPDWTLLFDYHGEVRSRTVRLVSAAGSTDPALRGVALTPTGRVEAAPVANDQLLILGDSINATVVPSTEAGAQMMTFWLERYLGFGASLNIAVGGSGYVSHNDRTFNLPELLANPVNQALLATYAPNITHVLIGAGFNDRSQPLATTQASALATWRTLRGLLPNARISITDGWSGSSGPDGLALALAAALTRTFTQWGDSNSRLIRSVGSSTDTAYVNGVGHAGAPVMPGNSSYFTSVDQVHPSPAGARHIARRLADDITTAWGGAY